MGVSYEDLAIGKLEINFESRRPSGVTDLSGEATRDIAAALNGLLADVFALYLKTKNFHWHVSGPHFRDYHRCLRSIRVEDPGLATSPERALAFSKETSSRV